MVESQFLYITLNSVYYYYRLEVLDNVNPDLSDSEFIIQAPTPGGDIWDGEDFEEPDENDEEDPGGDIDEELAADLDLALGARWWCWRGRKSEEDDSEEDDEDAQARKLFREEIRDLEAAVAEKVCEIASSGYQSTLKNSTMYIYHRSSRDLQGRFEDTLNLKKLTVNFEMKLAQRDEL